MGHPPSLRRPQISAAPILVGDAGLCDERGDPICIRGQSLTDIDAILAQLEIQGGILADRLDALLN